MEDSKSGKACPRGTGLFLALVVVAAFASGCSSPADKAREFYDRGNSLFERGEYAKAVLEYRNALQVKGDMVRAWYALAQVYEKQGQWDRVFSTLKRVLDLDANHVGAQVTLGKLFLAAGQIDAALEYSNSTLKLSPEAPEVLAFRAAVLYGLEDRVGAAEVAKAALLRDPENVDALIVLSTERIASGAPGEAIAYLDRGLRVHASNVALMLIKIQALDELDETEEAEAIYGRLIRLYPQERGFRQRLARHHLERGRVDRAEMVYRGIVEESPDDVEARLDLIRFLKAHQGDDTAEKQLRAYIEKAPDERRLSILLAELYSSVGKEAEAREVYHGLIATDSVGSSGLAARSRLAAMEVTAGEKGRASALIGEVLAIDARNIDALMLRAHMAIEDLELGAAIGDLRTVLREQPGAAPAMVLLGKAHELGGELALAGDQYRRAFINSAGDPAIGTAYVDFLRRQGNAATAEEILLQLLTGTPGYLPALEALAHVRIELSDWVGAEQVAEQIRQLGDQNRISSQLLGAVYAAQKRAADSIAAFRDAYDTAPTAVQPMVSLVGAYVRAGKHAEAQNFLKTVLTANPRNPLAGILLSRLYLLNGDLDSARRHLHTFVEQDPRNAAGYLELAGIHARDSQLEKAQAVIEQGLRQLPEEFGLRLMQASLNEQSGNFEVAIRQYEALYLEHPNADIIVNNLASLLSDHGRGAEEHRRAVRLASRFKGSKIPHYQDTLGWAYVRAGRVEEALPLLKAAVAENPDILIFRYHLGMAYQAAQRSEDARRELESVLVHAAGDAPIYADKIEAALVELSSEEVSGAP